MTSENKRSLPEFSGTVGMISLLAALLILCLAVFAALSLSTAVSDLRLSEKSANALSEYYAADAAAEEKLSALAALPGKDPETLEANGYMVKETEAGLLVSFDLPINDKKYLHAEIKILDETGTFTRECWETRIREEE